jgi:probable F420-dependent oxidoreductase
MPPRDAYTRAGGRASRELTPSRAAGYHRPDGKTQARERALNYGFYLPTRGPTAEPDAIAALVRRGEAKGFHSVMVADHVVFPVEVKSHYPYTADGVFPGGGDALEQLSLMAFVAGISEKLRIVSSIMVVPHRNPVLTAKMLATIDVLSKGRVTVGVGVGWMREEFEALHAADFDRRGAVSDEYIRIFKRLWTQDPAAHEGEFYRFGPLHCRPFPVQRPHPPIWIGGHSRIALKRVARHGDGWHPVGANVAVPLRPAELAPLVSELKQRCEAEGRDFGKLDLSFKAPLYNPDEPMPDGERRPFVGSPAEIVEDVHTYRDLGFGELIFDVRTGSLSESLERLDRFAEEIMPHA